MESEERRRSMERSEYSRMSDFFGVDGDSTVSCDSFSLNSASPHRMNTCPENISEDTAEVELWKDALISRNMDLVNCCLQAVLGDLPSSERSFMGKLMATVLKEVEDITVRKVEIPARSIFTELESSEGVEVKKAILSEGDKIETSSMKTPNRYRYKQPRNRGFKSTKLSNSFVCPGCERFIAYKSYCPACASFVHRVERDIDNGTPPPSCQHEDYKGAPKCRSCRYNKYNELWRFRAKNSTNTQKETAVELECMGCLTPLKDGTLRCTSCFSLMRKILEARSLGKPIPSCYHENYSGCPDCESCRLTRYLKRENMPPRSYQCGSCFQMCISEKCIACYNFGTSLEKAHKSDSIPKCLIHQNGEGAPSCINCRYCLWKDGKMINLGKSPSKQKEILGFRQEQAMKWIKQEEDLGMKPDLKRIKIEW